MFYQDLVIYLSPYRSKYADLIANNCLCEKKSINNIDIILSDRELKNTLYNLIMYGNFISKTNKVTNTHSQLLSLEDYNKYLTSIELEKFQRIYFYLDKVLLSLLIFNLITFYLVIL